MMRDAAYAFLDEARQNRAFRMAVQEYLLSRDVHKLVNFGQERGFEFTAQEIARAVSTYWDMADLTRQNPPIATAYAVPQLLDYVLHPVNWGYLSGQRRRPVLRYRGMALWVRFLVVVILAGITWGLGAAFVTSYTHYTDLRDHGVVMEGHIVGHRQDRVSTRGGTRTDYYVTFRYTVDGIAHSQEQKVNREQYDSLPKWQPCAVLYSPSDPEVAVLDGTNRYEPLYLGGVLLTGPSMIGLAGVGLRQYRREWLYGKTGTVVAGEITSVNNRFVRAGRHRVLISTLEIQFIPPNAQALVTQTIECHLPGLRWNRPKQGKVSILYVDADHWWVL